MKLVKSYDDCFDGASWVPLHHLHNWFCYVGAYVCRPVVKLLTRYRVCGIQNIPQKGDAGVLFACNHVSFMDPCVLWCALYTYGQGCRILARSSLFRPLLGALIARAGAIPIEPESADRTALKRAVACLKRGESLLIFPEGTRMNRPDKVYHPHAGIVLIAQMGRAKIVPVGISGTEKIMPYGSHVPRLPKVYVNFGEAIDPADECFAELPKKGRAQHITQEVMSECFSLRDAARES